MPAGALLSLLLLSSASSSEVDAWVHDRVDAQREPLTRAGPPAPSAKKTLWKERPANDRGAIPNFTPPTSLAPLVKAVRAGVVNISTRNEGTSRSLGSGFVINPDGLVVTNNHVVERAQTISVRLADGRELDAEVVGRDPATDLALLKLGGAAGLACVNLGDSDLLEVGDWVVAIGNPFGLDTSVTHGIISARERVIGVGPFDDFIQTNATINPGNSGGPLFDLRGDVVGVTTAIMSQGQGIGFAVPINLVKDLLPNLLDNGRPERGWLGVNVQEIVEGQHRSAVVVDVFQDSPAAKAGVKPGDRVISVGGKPVERYQHLLRRIALLAPGTSVKLGLLRGTRMLEVSPELAQRPAAEAMRAMAAGGRIDALGLAVRELEPVVAKQLGVDRALRVEVVVPGGAAEAGGLGRGDLVLEVNRTPVGTLKELDAALAEEEPGAPVLLKYKRGDSSRYVALRPRP